MPAFIPFVLEPCNISVTYDEFEGSPDISIREGRLSVRRIFLVDWSDIWTFAKELLGWSEVVGNNIVIHMPHYFKQTGAFRSVSAQEIISIRGFPLTGLVETPTDIKKAEYTQAQVVVMYERPEYTRRNDNDALVSESIEPASEFITYSNKGLNFNSAGVISPVPTSIATANLVPVEESEAPAGIIRMFDWVYTYHKMPYIPAPLIDYTGYVNQYPITSASLGMTYPEGTALLGNPSITRDWTIDGIGLWKITVRITVRRKDWNLFPKPSLGGMMEFLPIYDDGGLRTYPFPYTDYAAIIL